MGWLQRHHVKRSRAGRTLRSPRTISPVRRTSRRRIPLLCVAVAAVVAAALGLSAAMAAPPKTFIVDDTADLVDASVGNGVCQTSAGTCTLRAATQEANAIAGADLILILPGTYAIAIAPINENAANVGDFEILDPVTIEKAPTFLGDVVIDGGNPLPSAPIVARGLDRLFEIHPGAGDVTFRNVILQNGFSPEEGGAIQNWSLGKLTLDGVTVRDSYAEKAGGGLNHADLSDYEWATEPPNLELLPHGRVEIKGSTFTGNGAGGGGAAINNVSGGTITISDESLITLNPGPIKPDPLEPEEFVLVDPSDYPIDASAISNQARYESFGTLKISNSTVSLNASEDSGAGISSWGDSVVTIDNASTISQNRTGAEGGGLFSEGGKVGVVDSEVSKNQAANGGGLYSGGHVSRFGLRGRFGVKDSQIFENIAENGGGIYSDDDGQLFVTDTTFTKNHSSDHGAAISTSGRSSTTLTRIQVIENESNGEGGGVWTHSERQQTIVDSTFARNKAGVPVIEDGELSDDVAGGGGLYTDGGPVTILGTTFEENDATEEGGGISMHNLGDVVLRDSILRNNRAFDGGGTENSATRVTFERVLVQGNRAGGEGGGIFNTSSGEFYVLDSTIRENSAVVGGGLANAPDNHIIVRGSLFLNNSARMGTSEDGDIEENAGKGGGIMSYADGQSLYENTTISGNRAASGGGGLFHDADGELRLVHMTIWRNSAPAGGGIGVVESDFSPDIPPKTNSSVIVKNSIVGGSIKGGNCDWYVRSEGGNLETGERNTCFLAVTAETAQSPIELGVRDRRGDPQLWALADNGGPTLTHALQWGSLAIDSSHLPCSVVDQRGIGRPQNGKCDAGAFEFVGAPPVFDDTPPETFFDPAIDGPKQDSEATMAFTFRGTDNLTIPSELNFECRLIEHELTEPPEPVAPWDPIPTELMWNGCSSPWSTKLFEGGLLTFEVRAIDRAGNVDSTPISYLLSGDDLLPPDTVIIEKPPLQTNSRSALFSFTGISDFTPPQFMEFECRLDSRDPAQWLECTNPAMYSNLSTGLHTFEVRAVSEVGAVEGDPTPARYTWRIGPDPENPSDTPLDCDEANITMTAAADGWADQVNPLENYLFETELDMRSDATDPGAGQPLVPENARAFFRFNIPDDAPDCELESATLRLYSSSHTEGRTLEAVPLEDAWKESTLNWINQPDPYPGAAAATAESGELYREWDVKDHVDAIRAGDLPSNGWVIRDQNESEPGGGDQTFLSREYPQDPPEVTLPELELRYVAAGTPPPPAPPEPVGETTVHCGQVITESTRLAGDVTGCLGEGIAIGAPNIVLDLNGYTVSSGLVIELGEEDGLTPGIRNSYPNVVIRNGVVTNFGYGVLMGPGSAHGVVEDMTLYRNILAGVHLFDADNGRTGVVVRGNRLDSNGETGVQVFAGTEGSLVEDNYFVSNGMSIHLDASRANVIRNNEISGIILDPLLDSDAGVVLENGSRDNLVENTDVSDTGDAGIVIHQGSHGNRVLGGVLVRNGDAGVIVQGSDRIEIDGVVAHQQSDGGVVIANSSGSSVKNSDLRFNPSGVDASNTNGLVVAGNDVSNSLQAGIGLGNGIGMSILDNTANLTGGSGISLEGGAFDANGAAVGGALIEGNTANQNAEHGISVAVAKHTIRGNNAHNNAGFGIAAGELEAADPSVANVDGGGNSATGNGEFVQCLGVVCDETGSVPLIPQDTSAPQTTITDGPLGPPPPPAGGSIGGETSVLTFTADDGPNGTPLTAMTFECRLDAPPDPVEPVEPELEPPDPNPEIIEPPEGENWVECVSPLTILGLEPGEHKFEVRAVDWAGNFDPTPAEYVWTIHAGVEDEGQNEIPPVAPETRITGAPGELITDEAGTRYDTTNQAATFSFVGSDNLTAGYNLSFECRTYYEELNDELTPADMPSEAELPFGPCSSPKQYTGLEYGGHIFEVRAIDLAGNKDVMPAWHAWWIHPPPPDIAPPDTTITAGPDRTTVATTALFEFTGTDNQTAVEDLAFECRLDGEMAGGEPLWTDCSSPYQVTVSSPATLTEHVLQVRAVDQSGNVDDVNGTTGDALPDGVPAAFVWTVGPAAVPKTVFCGQKITQSTKLNNNLGDCLGHGLIVGADNITIDLNGKTIDGKSIGAGILNNGYDSVTIKNGTLTDFDFGVLLTNGTKSNIVESVTAQHTQDAGLSLGQPTAPEDPNFPPPEPLPGFLSGVDGNILRSNTVVANSRGVWLTNGAKDNVVRENLIGSTSGEAVWIDRAGLNLIEGNDIQLASKFGVLLEGATGNTIKGNSIADVGTGVLVGATTTGTIGIESIDNRIEGNLIAESGGPALRIVSSSGNELIDNVGTGADSAAIDLYLADENVVRGNEVSGNKGGLTLNGASGNVIESNNAGESDGTGITLQSQSFNNVLRANTSSNNTGAGIYISDETPAGQGTLVEGNTTNANNGMGIQASKPSHIFKGNVAMDNDNWGINVGDPSNGRANVDGGGNIAQGNKGPLGVDLKPQQCYNISCTGAGGGGGDLIAPTTSILEAPLDPNTENLAVFSFTGTDNQTPIVFECRFNSTLESAWQTCTSPTTYNGLENAQYTFEVRARDLAGNVDPTPASHTWTVVLGDFAASIDSTPEKVTVETEATFEFSANRASGVTFQCVLQPAVPPAPVDWDAAPTCTSPRTYTGLAPGLYQFWVRATDTADSEFDTKMYAWTIGPAPVPAEVSCGQILTQSTRLLNDLVDCGGYGLIVGAPGITIDLDGHVVDGQGLDAGILNNGHDDVTIKGGLVAQFLYGIQLNPGTARNVVHSIRVEGNAEAGIVLSDAYEGADGNTIRDNSLVGNEIGIALYTGTRHAVIRGNTLGANAGEGGILLEFASQNLIEGNQIGMSGGAGIFIVGGGSNTVSDNVIRDSGGYGVVAGEELVASTNNVVRGNTIRGGQGGVLVAGDGNTVLNNTVNGSTGPGVSVELATNTVVKGNDFGGNASGVAVSESSGTLVEANNASGTLGAGIAVGELSGSTILRDNTASGNGGGGIEVADSSVVGQGTLIDGNTADSNGGDGIYVEGAGHTITGNVAQLNGGWGMYNLGGLDGGGNFAAGNMEPDQCFGVVCELGLVPGAPDTWVVSGPADADPGTPGVQSSSRNASFTYLGSDEPNPITDLVFECRVDSTSPTAWEDCAYPAEYLNLSPGEHTFEVRAVDMMGQGLADPTPAVFTWTYVPLPFGVAPEVILDVTPPAETFLLEAIFTFHSNEPDVTFQCRVDSNGYQPCGFEGATFMNQGAFEWAFLPNEVGLHTFFVRAIDFEGNVGAETTYTWRILGVTVEFTDGPGFTPATGGPGGDPATGGPTASTSAEIHFESNASDALFWCRFDSLDPAGYFPCESPFRAGPAHVGNTEFPDPLAVGSHMLEVFAESELMGSAAELEPAVYEWEVVETLDTTPPETFIERAPGPLDLSSTIFEFSGTDDLTPPFLLTFECQVTAGTEPPNENEWVACTSPFNLLDVYSYADPQMLLTEHTFYVRAIDMAEPEFPDPQLPGFEGNPDPTPASHTWTPVADTRAPSATISAGPAEGAVVAEVEPFEFFGLDNATPALQLEFQCAVIEAPLGLEAAEWAPCDSPHAVGGLDPAQYTFAVRAVDLMGNAGPAATRSFTVVGMPVVSILSGPDGRIDPDTGVPSQPFSNTESAVFTFSSDQPGSTFECSLDGGEFLPCNTPAGTEEGVFAYAAWVVLSGGHEVAVRATNAQGIVGEETVYEWLVELGPDITEPSTTITSGPENGTLSQIGIFTFTGSDNRTATADLSFECALDSTTSWSSCTSPEQFENLSRGSHTLRVRAIDAAGNMDSTPAEYTWIVAPPPVVTILSGPGVEVEGSTDTSATFTFSSDVAGVTFHCWLDGAFNPAEPGTTPPQPAPCASGVTYENLGLGPHLFAVRAVDGFGNIGVWEDVEFTVLPPEARITSAPASGTSTTATFEFTSEPFDPDAEFYCSLDGRPFGLCTSPKEYTNLWPGEHTFQVQTVYTGLDWRGEPLEFEPVPATHTWTVIDLTPPETSIDFGPPATTISTSAYLGVSSDDPTATITCTLNGAPAECEPGAVTELTDLAPGSYTFTAQATDPSGNVDATPASRSWTIATPTGDPNTPVGSNVVVSLPLPGGGGSATVTFFSVETAGFTTLDALDGGPPLPEGFGGATASIYDISTTAAFTEPVVVCLPYNPLDYGSETPPLRLLHFDGSEWVEITTLNDPFSVPGRICGEAEGFSLFAIATASPGMAPETYILSGPDGPLNAEGIPTSTSGSATFEFWADQPGTIIQCSIDGDPFFFCESPVTVGPLAAGDHEFMVQAINEFGWMDLTPAVFAWEVIGPDVTPPSTTITRGPGEGTSTPNFISTFEFSGTDDFTPALELAFQCTLDGVDLGNCETPEEIEVTTPGPHTLLVQAIDEAGNLDPVGATRNWTVVDMSGPDTEITLGPVEETAETTATFEFVGFELLDGTPVDQFECALDSGPFVACTTPHTVSGLSAGAHVFHVRAVDPDGNRDISPAFYEWLVITPPDTTPPDTTIVSAPDPANSGPDVTFVFGSNEPVESFECSFGAGTPPAAPTTWQGCGPALFLEGLDSGQHWLWVRAIDAAGNVDPTPAPGEAPFTWITTGQPDTFITQAPDDPTGEFSAAFVFGSDQAGATFQCSVDGSPWTACTSSPTDPYIAGPFLPEENGAPSEHSFEVRAVNQYIDSNGEQVMDLSPATHDWRVQDMSPPDTEFLGATEIGPEQFLEPGLRFSFRGDDDWASSFELTFECALDNTADPLPPVWEECGEPGADDSFFHDIAFVDLEAGPYTFQVRAIDVAENTDQSPAPDPGYSFVVEAEPETTILTVTPDMGPDLQTDTTTVSFTFSGTGVSFECALDSALFTPCSSGVEYTNVPYGTHLFRVQAVAQFGTRDQSPAEFAWESGFLTAPDVTITSAPPTTGSTSATATFEFDSTDPDASFLCTLDGVGPQPCESPRVYEGLLAGAQNPHTFEVVATKPHLLVGGVPATHQWTITDDVAPETVLLAPLPANPSADAVELRFTGTDNGTLPANLDFECALDGAAFAPCSSPLSLTELTGGQHTFQVRATDEVPLTDLSPASHVWNVIAPPATQITAAPAAISNSPDATFEFFDQPGSTYECRLDPVDATSPWAACTSPQSYSGLTNGAHVFEVRATTLPLNGTSMVEDPPAEHEWTIDAPDSIAPETTIDLGPVEASPTTATSASFLFSGTDNLTPPVGLTFQCSLDGALFADCESGIEYTGLSAATHTFEVRAVDPEGNFDETPASRSWTVVAGSTNTLTGTDVEVDLGGGASATFADVTGAGVTSLTVLSGAPPLPAGFSGAGALFFDLSTTATFLGDVEVCLPYGPASLDEPHLVHFDGSEWVDVTTELDPANGIVCGVVSSLSPFGVAEAPGLSPETEIVQAPADPTLESVPGGAEVQFQFGSNDQLADFECAIDGAAWSSCDTPYQFTAAIGQHTLLVRARSQAGAFDLTPSTHAWTVLARPVATIDSGPVDQAPEDPGIQNESRTATFTFSSDQLPSTFECRFTGESTGTAWELCTSPKTYENLGLEEYTLEVQAINAAGHASLIPAQFEWEVADLTPPNTTIHSGPDDPTSATSATFTFSADEPATFQCLLDGLPSACGSGLTITNLGAGTHTFEVLATDLSERENVELEPAVWTWTVDTQAPVVTLLETPPAEDTQTSGIFRFGASDNHSSSLELECRLDGQPAGWESCTSPRTYAGLLPGDHTFEIRATDAAGNVGSASHGWEILDTIVPETEITAIEPGSIVFHFTGSDDHSPAAALTFECSLDGAPFSPCVSPKTYENSELSVGQHTFEVRAVDEAGNVDPTPESHTWTVLDVTAPETTITGQPEASTSATSASFTFTGSDDASAGADLAFECSLDGNAFGACTSPASYSGLAVGPHTFQVRAVDEAGNADASPASFGWTVLDVTAPETSITAQPDASTGSTAATFEFTGTDNGTPAASLTFECSLDGAAFGACTSPKSYSGLSVGPHTFQVRAIDAAGNVDQGPAGYAWTVLDTIAPQTTITAQPAASTGSTSASFEFAGSDDTSPAASLSFQCSLDGAAFAACTSPKSYFGLSVGSHTFEVRATDGAGNVDASPASYSWTVLDTIAPETTITGQPDSPTPSAAASFGFTGSDDTTAAASLSFQCSLDGAAFAACSSPKDYSGLAAGSHTFQVRAIDAAGNVDASPASYTWTVLDTTAPETTITAQPAASTGSTSASFEFTGSDNVTPAASLSFECSLDGAAFAACTSPKPYSGLSVGSHTFQVRATDAAGNVDSSPASYSWTVLDTIAPDTTITGQPDATTPSTDASFGFTGSDDTTGAASLSFECSLDGAAFAACSSPKSYSGLSAGSHTFRVRAIDAAGNVDGSPASYTWTILDTIAPDTTITGQPVSPTTTTSANFTFTGSDDVTVPASLAYECALDGAAFAACTSPTSHTDLVVGFHTFQVRATDAAGNVDATPASYTWEIQMVADTTAPETTITAQPPETTTETNASFSFSSSEAPSTFECSLDNAAFAACTWPKSYSGLAVGSHNFRVRAIDGAGNVDATPAGYSWAIQSPTVDCGPQQTLTASADAWIDQGSPSSNKGSDSILKVMSKSGSNLRALFRFNLPAMPQGCSVQSATLRIYAASGAGGRTLQAFQLGGSWTEGGVNWSNQPATAGSAATTSSGSGYRDWNVAGQVQAMYTGANNGFLVRDATENQDAEQQFHSRENSNNRPLLVLQLGSGAPPPPPSGGTAPDTSITGSPLSATTSTSATFTFTGVDDATPASSLTFECQLDVPETSSWTACATPRSYSGLAQGTHTFRVRAVDAALNVDASPAVYTWTIDQTAPETVISDGPGSSTTSTSASFSFTSPEPGAVFECALDGAAFAACTSPKSYSGLAVGSHTFQVRARDAAGNIDATPASYPWTIQSGGTVNCGSAQTMTAVADSWIDQSSSASNKGTDSILKVMSKSGNANLRALVRFNLPSIPSGCVLDAATLRVYAGSASSSQRTLQALRLNGSWTETGVTWGNQPATTGSAVTTTSGTGYRQWGVGAIVQNMYSSGSNNGFLIRDATESQDAEQQFHSRETGSNPPQLVVTFKPAP
ncbi:MAG TPA: right-handed parallel beta-helix repeat-containing protein [Gaiellaceae bacterium]